MRFCIADVLWESTEMVNDKIHYSYFIAKNIIITAEQSGQVSDNILNYENNVIFM